VEDAEFVLQEYRRAFMSAGAGAGAGAGALEGGGAREFEALSQVEWSWVLGRCGGALAPSWHGSTAARQCPSGSTHASASPHTRSPLSPLTPLQLRGPWAFIVYDRLHGRIVAARDPAGLEPLFWGTTLLSEGVLFATDR
jgi:hypothetical protein